MKIGLDYFVMVVERKRINAGHTQLFFNSVGKLIMLHTPLSNQEIDPLGVG